MLYIDAASQSLVSPEIRIAESAVSMDSLPIASSRRLYTVGKDYGSHCSEHKIVSDSGACDDTLTSLRCYCRDVSILFEECVCCRLKIDVLNTRFNRNTRWNKLK